MFRGTPTLTSVTDKVSRIVEGPPPRWWWIAFAFSLSLLGLGVFAATYLISTGVGVWGLNQPVGWAFDITNFVFWVGIGHAGTLISAILLLFRQKWRTSINRFAEAMTLFAVACAGIFPAHSRWSHLDDVVFGSRTQQQRHLAKLSQSLAVGRVCGLNLRTGFR